MSKYRFLLVSLFVAAFFYWRWPDLGLYFRFEAVYAVAA
jgi:hypothetical protein